MTPLDPTSPAGQAMATRLTRTLAAIEHEIATRQAAEPGHSQPPSTPRPPSGPTPPPRERAA
jgi:hypothetical protein